MNSVLVVASVTVAGETLSRIDSRLRAQIKQVNDRAGHAAGDELLAGLGRSRRAELRRSELLARLRSVSPIGWSAGIVEWEGNEWPERALARADEELYREKAQLLVAP